MKNGYKEVRIGPKKIEIPDDWEVKNIGGEGGLCKVKTGGTPSTKTEEYWGGNIAWAVPTDITKNGSIYISDTEKRITEEGLKHSSANLLPEGSILLTTRATIGEASINKIPMATNQGFKSLICKNDIDNLFLYYIIQSEKKRLQAYGGGSTFDEVSKKDVVNFPILTPPLLEQKNISKIIFSVDRAVKHTEQVIEKTKRLKKGLMQDLLTGKVRVNNIELEET
jgi:type I restriction enzyme S subunit